MRRLALVIAFLVSGLATDAAGQSRPAANVGRIDRVEHWLKAVLHHVPGTNDEAVARAGSWSASEMGTLWIDLNHLVALTRNPRIGRFDIRQPGQRRTETIRYTTAEMHRLRVLACAAGGIVTSRECLAVKAATELDAELLQLARLADDSRLHGDDNYILRRGALLHTDVAMLTPTPTEPVNGAASLIPQTVKMSIADGRETDFGQTAVHWVTARTLLDRIRPREAERPAPGRDEMVRQWYRATAAWMQWRETHDTEHLRHARQIFPDDPDILFLIGTLHETYAGPRIQNAVRDAVLPTGYKLDVGGDRAELREAETFLRRVVELKPDFGEAHLRFGHVLLVLGRHAEAAKELADGLATSDDDVLRYYGELFLGAAREALGDLDAARASYQRAAELQPAAQSPLIALSALARRRGDRAGALRDIRRVFELRSNGAEAAGDEDPWWTYHVHQARNAEELFEELIKPFQSDSEAGQR